MAGEVRGQEEERKSEKIEGRGWIPRRGGFREAKHVAHAGHGHWPQTPRGLGSPGFSPRC